MSVVNESPRCLCKQQSSGLRQLTNKQPVKSVFISVLAAAVSANRSPTQPLCNVSVENNVSIHLLQPGSPFKRIRFYFSCKSKDTGASGGVPVKVKEVNGPQQ